MVFHDYKFRVKRVKRKYRVLEKAEFEKSYHSFVDVQAVRELKDGIRYVTKYLIKARNESQTQNLTLALCWIFKKRSFSVSGDLYEFLRMEIKNSSLNILVQTDLQGVAIRLRVEWIFIGIFSAERLGIDRDEWWKVITDRAVLSDILT